MTAQTLGQRIKEEREARKWSHVKLAYEVSRILERPVGEGQIKRWEHAKGNPNDPHAVPAIAEAFGLTVTQLLSGVTARRDGPVYRGPDFPEGQGPDEGDRPPNGRRRPRREP